MITYVCILRGINVGGRRKLKMQDLKDALAQLGYLNVRTYIQSGNVIFESKEEDRLVLEEKISAKILDKFSYEVPAIIRTKKEFLFMVDQNPYVSSTEINQMVMTFLKSQPNQDLVEELKLFKSKEEDFVVKDSNLFLKCGERYSQVKLNNGFIERKLKIGATTRGWKTILKMKELL